MDERLRQAIDEKVEGWLNSIGIYIENYKGKEREEYESWKNKLADDLLSTYSEKAMALFLFAERKHKMFDCTCSACITGPCGDTMEFFIKIEDNTVSDVSFITDGCDPSVAAGGMAAEIAIGKTPDALKEISQDIILEELGRFPAENAHCALLAANTIKKALEDGKEKS